MSEHFVLNDNKKDHSNKVGLDTQDMFVMACQSVGYTCEKSSNNVDLYDHIDYFVKRTNNTITSVDVKGGNHPTIIWIEFKNVAGYAGWLYGKAEMIAFDMPELNGFVIVERKELADLCEEIVEKVFVPKTEATRKLYSRKGRKDVISRLHLTDLMKLKSYRLLKYPK